MWSGPRRVSHRRRQLRCICCGLPTEAGARSRRGRPGLEDGGGVDPAILPGDRLSTERQARRPARSLWLLLHLEDPDDAPWGTLSLTPILPWPACPGCVGHRRPSRLDGDVLGPVDLIATGAPVTPELVFCSHSTSPVLASNARTCGRCAPTKTRSPPVASTVAMSCHRKLCCHAFLPVAGSRPAARRGDPSPDARSE